MAVELTPLGKFVVTIVKWLVIPLCVAFIGYALIGPRIGGKVVKRMRAIPGMGSALGNDSSESESRATNSDENARRFQSIRGIGQ